jgi:hypothetical protein
VAPTTTTSTTIAPTTTTTTTAGVYTYNFNQCCDRVPIILYSSSSPIVVGSVLYTNIGLTTLYTNTAQALLTTDCPPDYTPFTGAIIVNASGVVISTTYGEECGA